MSGKEYHALDQDEEMGDGSYETRMQCVQSIREVAQSNLNANYERFRTKYDLRKRSRTFDPGQSVFRRNFSQSDRARGISAKLADRFVKAKVVRHSGPNAVILSDLSGKEIGVFHLKDIFSA